MTSSAFARAHNQWLEEPEEHDIDAAYDAKCNQAYDNWKEEREDDE